MAENLENDYNEEFNNEDAGLNVSPGLTLEVREDPQAGNEPKEDYTGEKRTPKNPFKKENVFQVQAPRPEIVRRIVPARLLPKAIRKFVQRRRKRRKH